MNLSRRIALAFSYDLGYCRAVLRGVKAYATERPDWIFAPIDPGGDVAGALAELKPAGILAHVYRRPLAAAIVRSGRPVVNVAGVLDGLTFPHVGLDNRAIGQMAAEHLLSAGFRNFAFVGHSDQLYSRAREAAFLAAVGRPGVTAQTYHVSRRAFDPRGRPWALDQRLCRWLAALPAPVAVFACNDLWGNQLAEACRQAKRRVPEDVAILGVDNDDLMCELARPSLSSVQVPGEAIGYQAARMLGGLMAKRRRSAEAILLPPIKVVVRHSTDVVAVNDHLLAGALRHIRQRAAGRLAVSTLCQEMAVSRRLLERRFREHLGRGIWEEIRRCRVERACALLAGSNLPVGRIAATCGFTSARHLSVTFRDVMQTTPRAYRAGAHGE